LIDVVLSSYLLCSLDVPGVKLLLSIELSLLLLIALLHLSLIQLPLSLLLSQLHLSDPLSLLVVKIVFLLEASTLDDC
jgi:hypothetical protein